MSVVIPCFNYARFLPQAVQSALTQASVKVDVIVVDDASTDDSLAVARDLATRDARITVVANRANAGPVDTFNRGLALATGEFLVRLDADDMLTPGSLARSVALLQALPEVGLVYGHPVHFTGDAPPRPRADVDKWLVWEGRRWLAARCIDGTNAITSPEVVMRRSVVDVVGGQRPLAHTHDMEMWLRISAHSDVAFICGADQAWHRDHPASLSNAAADPLIILHEIRDAFEELFRGLGPLTPELERSYAAARRAVALAVVGHGQNLVYRGQPDAVGGLMELAVEADSSVRGTTQWHRLERSLGRPAGLTRLYGVAPRARGRLRHHLRYRRWTTTGVYEALRILPDAPVGGG